MNATTKTSSGLVVSTQLGTDQITTASLNDGPVVDVSGLTELAAALVARVAYENQHTSIDEIESRYQNGAIREATVHAYLYWVNTLPYRFTRWHLEDGAVRGYQADTLDGIRLKLANRTALLKVAK